MSDISCQMCVRNDQSLFKSSFNPRAHTASTVAGQAGDQGTLCRARAWSNHAAASASPGGAHPLYGHRRRSAAVPNATFAGTLVAYVRFHEAGGWFRCIRQLPQWPQQ